MEVCPEVCVLVSASELASATDTPREKQLEIWKAAVQEILNGLESDHTDLERELWDYKLHTLLFCSTLKNLCHDQNGLKTEDFGQFSSVLTVLHPCPREVYYELVKFFKWRKHLLECLQFLSSNETIWLLAMEDLMSYCSEGDGHKDPAATCELLTVITEFFLVDDSQFGNNTNAANSVSSRKVSGLYMYMGPPPTPGSSDSSAQGGGANTDLIDRYKALFSDLNSCVKGLCLSESALQTLNTECQTKFTENPVFTLIMSVVALGWTFLWSSHELAASQSFDETFRENPSDAWEEIFVQKPEEQEVGRERKEESSLEHLMKHLKSEKASSVEKLNQILLELEGADKSHKVTRFHRVLPVEYFPANQWQSLMVDIFSSKWEGCLLSGLESWNATTEPSVTLMTMSIKLCQLFSHVEKVLNYRGETTNSCINSIPESDISPTKEVENDTSVQLSPTLDEAGENSQSVESSTPAAKEDRVSAVKVEADLLTILQPLVQACARLLGQIANSKVDEEVSETAQPWSLEVALESIESKDKGWEDCLDQVLSQETLPSPSTSPSFWSALQKNTEYLCTEKRVTLLFDLVQRSQDQTTAEKGWKVLLLAFGSLPLMLQDHMLSVWYGRDYRTIPLSDHHYSADLTATCNRLVNGGYTECVAVCGLALQNPEGLMEKLVSVALKNKQQTQLILQILQKLPETCLSRPRHGDDNQTAPLLCKTVHSVLCSSSLSQKEENNLVEFITKAVQEFENNSVPQLTFTENPILDAAEFLRLSAVPFISNDNMLKGSQPITALFGLRLFNSLCRQSYPEGLSDLAPVTLCLCEMLAECDHLWDREDARKDILKGEIITAVGYLPFDRFADSSRTWLAEPISTYDLTILIRVRSLFGMDADEGLQEIALHLLAENSDTVGGSSVSEALRFASVDDSCLQAVIDAVSELHQSWSLTWEQLVLTLTQILPDLLQPEWMRVSQVCHHLMVSGRVRVTYPCTYIISLPWVHLPDVQVPLGVSKLLADCCMVWSQSNALRQQTWLHVAQGLVNCVKELCLGETGSPEGQTFLLTQIFCQLCQVLTILPPQTGDPVYFLMLQILTLYKGVKKLDGTANRSTTWWRNFLQDQETTMASVLNKLPSHWTQEKISLERQLKEMMDKETK